MTAAETRVGLLMLTPSVSQTTSVASVVLWPTA